MCQKMLMSSRSLPPPSPLPPPHYFLHNFSCSLLSQLLQLIITSKFYSILGLPPVSLKLKRIFLKLRLILFLHMSFTYVSLTILCFTNLLDFKLQVCSCKFLLLLLKRTKYMFFHQEMIRIWGGVLDKKWRTILILECWEKKLLKKIVPLRP